MATLEGGGELVEFSAAAQAFGLVVLDAHIAATLAAGQRAARQTPPSAIWPLPI